jgi:hypothetical protein
MTAEELMELLEVRPFSPLRLRLADGQTRDIHRRDLALVADNSVAIGIPADNHSKIARRVVRCALSNIVQVEPLESGGAG